MRRGTLLAALLLLLAIAGGAQAQTCIAGRTDDWVPFLGNANPDPSLNTPTVTLYTNNLGRNTPGLQQAAQGGADVWNNGCPRGGSSTRPAFPNIPGFGVNWSVNRPTTTNAERRGIQIDFLDVAAPTPLGPTGQPEINVALHGGNNVITAYRKCPATGSYPEYGCNGGGGLINWTLPASTTAMAHEIGHALGLDHSRETSAGGAACPPGLMSRKPPTGATAEGYCAFVDRALNDASPCVSETPSSTEAHPCEVAGRRPRTGEDPTEGIGNDFCETFPYLCDDGPTSWAGGAPVCNYFCVSYLSESHCEWGCSAPAVATYPGGVATSSAGSSAFDMSSYDVETNSFDVGTTSVGANAHQAPIMMLDAPAQSATVSGLITVSGYAHEFFHTPSMTFGIDGQEMPAVQLQTALFRDNAVWHWMRNRNPGFSAKIDTRRVPNGTHTLQIIATDYAGFPTKLERTITTNNTCFDYTPPTIAINVNSTVTGVVSINANTTDDVGVTKVDFYIDGVYKGTDNNAPFTWSWDTSPYSPAGHVLEAWSHDACANATYARKNVTVQKPANAAQYVSQSAIPTKLTTGQTSSVSVTMKNTGSSAWTANTNYKLGSQNPADNATWGMSRVLLNMGDSIGWNQQKTFTWTITAPSTPGTYTFKWRMVREGVEWFGDVTPTVTISVTAPNRPPGYQGCFVDSATRALPYQLGGTSHTVESCKQAAAAAGLLYGGLQYYGYCFGGNALAYQQVADSECNTPCTANPGQSCGGAWRNSIYASGYTPPIAAASIAWIQPAENSWGTPGTLTAAGHATNGAGNVQLVFRERADNGVWGPWTTVGWQAAPSMSGEWSNTISSGNPTNKCHWFDAYVNYSGVTSSVFNYRGWAGCP